LPREKQNVWKSCWRIGGGRLEWRGSYTSQAARSLIARQQ